MTREKVVVYAYFCDSEDPQTGLCCREMEEVTRGAVAPTKRGFIHGQVDADAQVRRAGWYVHRDSVLCPIHTDSDGRQP